MRGVNDLPAIFRTNRGAFASLGEKTTRFRRTLGERPKTVRGLLHGTTGRDRRTCGTRGARANVCDFSGMDTAARKRPLLGMAAGRRLGARQAPSPRDIPLRPNDPMGDRGVLTLGHVESPRQRRGAAPAPRIAMATVWPNRPICSNSKRGGRGGAPRRRGDSTCPSVRTLRSPSGSIKRARRSREHAVCSGPRRPLAAMPSKTTPPRDRHGEGTATRRQRGECL